MISRAMYYFIFTFFCVVTRSTTNEYANGYNVQQKQQDLDHGDMLKKIQQLNDEEFIQRYKYLNLKNLTSCLVNLNTTLEGYIYDNLNVVESAESKSQMSVGYNESNEQFQGIKKYEVAENINLLLSTLQRVIESLIEASEVVKQDMKKQKEINLQLQERFNDSEKELAVVNVQKSKLDEEVQSHKKQINELESEMTGLRNELEKYKKKYHESDEENKRLKDESSNLKEELLNEQKRNRDIFVAGFIIIIISIVYKIVNSKKIENKTMVPIVITPVARSAPSNRSGNGRKISKKCISLSKRTTTIGSECDDDEYVQISQYLSKQIMDDISDKIKDKEVQQAIEAAVNDVVLNRRNGKYRIDCPSINNLTSQSKSNQESVIEISIKHNYLDNHDTQVVVELFSNTNVY